MNAKKDARYMTRWFGGVKYRLLPVIASLAFSVCVSFPTLAAEINLSDLRGYSIESEWIANRRITRVETSGQINVSGAVFVLLTRYISQKSGASFNVDKVTLDPAPSLPGAVILFEAEAMIFSIGVRIQRLFTAQFRPMTKKRPLIPTIVITYGSSG